MRAKSTLRWFGVLAAVALLGAAPAPKVPPPTKPADGPGPRPPADPAAYDQALERIRTMSAEEAFGFAAYDHQLPMENLGRQTQPGSLRMASLTLQLRPEMVFENYQVAFSKKYLPLFQGRLGPTSAYLSFREADGFMRTVTVSGSDSTTVVVVAISDPDRLLHRPPPRPDHAPVDWPTPGVPAGTPADLETEDMGTFQRTRAIQVACADSAEPLSFYDTHLPEKGWLPDRTSRLVAREISTEEFRRGDEVCGVVSAFKSGACALNIICTSRK